MKSFIIIIAILSLTSCSHGKPSNAVYEKAKNEITATMDKQAKCWNNGDIDCYMDGYWKSDKLQFIGKSGLTFGWQNTLNGYKAHYPDKTAMGKLTLEITSMEQLSNDAVFVIGTWKLTRTADELKGYYSLLWKKIDGKWLIVTDHSS